MSENTKQKKDSPKKPKKNLEDISSEKNESDAKGNWSEDQKKKSYYYDDSHGYEIYNPEEDDDSD